MGPPSASEHTFDIRVNAVGCPVCSACSDSSVVVVMARLPDWRRTHAVHSISHIRSLHMQRSTDCVAQHSTIRQASETGLHSYIVSVIVAVMRAFWFRGNREIPRCGTRTSAANKRLYCSFDGTTLLSETKRPLKSINCLCECTKHQLKYSTLNAGVQNSSTV